VRAACAVATDLHPTCYPIATDPLPDTRDLPRSWPRYLVASDHNSSRPLAPALSRSDQLSRAARPARRRETAPGCDLGAWLRSHDEAGATTTPWSRSWFARACWESAGSARGALRWRVVAARLTGRSCPLTLVRQRPGENDADSERRW